MVTKHETVIPAQGIEPDQPWTPEAEKLYELGLINPTEANQRSGIVAVEHEVSLTSIKEEKPIQNLAKKTALQSNYQQPKRNHWRDRAQADRYSSPDGTKYKR